MRIGHLHIERDIYFSQAARTWLFIQIGMTGLFLGRRRDGPNVARIEICTPIRWFAVFVGRYGATWYR